jgi:RHS repeat-associated protein
MTSAGGTYYYHANQIYSIAALTDSTGNVVERYTYDPYGKVQILAADGVTVRTASAVGNPWTFTGRRLDGETGLMYYRARMYSTELGRFAGRDPIKYEGSPWNLYEYCKGNPAGALDPSGTTYCKEEEGYKHCKHTNQNQLVAHTQKQSRFRNEEEMVNVAPPWCTKKIKVFKCTKERFGAGFKIREKCCQCCRTERDCYWGAWYFDDATFVPAQGKPGQWSEENCILIDVVLETYRCELG